MKLPVLEPNAARSDRLRQQCHERLARQRTRREQREMVAIRVERAVVCAVSAVYLMAVARNALDLFR